MAAEKREVILKEGLWSDERSTGGEVQLLGSECLDCGEVFSAPREIGLCGYCQSKNLKSIRLSTRGKIYSYTVIMQRPPVYYQGPVPYAIGFVELPEGVRVETLFTDCNFDDLQIGLEVELVLRKLHQDEAGNDVITYMFRPAA
ncbi:MAG: hypothetical protein C4519_16015 [Desulfobacteraceae bacterium]|nr:MAG: hypothetical protein C4519_16015 [Desulfobacteraceae bacterium]